MLRKKRKRKREGKGGKKTPKQIDSAANYMTTKTLLSLIKVLYSKYNSVNHIFNKSIEWVLVTSRAE